MNFERKLNQILTEKNNSSSYRLPTLPYPHGALKPHITARTMEIHHGKHHKKYVTELNAALKGHAGLSAKTVEDLITNLSSVPEKIRTSVRNNGGGHANHSFFWKIIGPDGGGTPSGELSNAINSDFGSLSSFKEDFAEAATTRFGNGWAWLCTSTGGKLSVGSTPNQDSPLMKGTECPGTPILGLDVWEHAYYLDYQNRRPDYVKAFWNVVQWDNVAELYEEAGS